MGTVINNAEFVTEPTTEALTKALERALAGERPPTDPTGRASPYDCDEIAEQVEAVYRSAISNK